MQTPRLDALGVRDVRAELPTAPQYKIGTRPLGEISSVTLHYSGPAVRGDITSDARIMQVLKSEAQYHIDKNWDTTGGVRHGDGLMYTFAILPSGAILLCRNLDAYLYHCGSDTGNPKSIAVHIPIGGDQRPTDAQLNAFYALADALIGDFGLSGRNAIKAHLEWKRTECPGPVLWPALQEWRSAVPSAAPAPVASAPAVEVSTPLDPQRYFRTRWSKSYVREGPGRKYDTAVELGVGAIFIADATKTGEVIEKSNVWFHNRDGSGFAHSTVLQVIDTHPSELCFIGAPTITLDRWTQVLERGKSPALIADPATLYHIPISYGINPAVALGFFLHESSLGTKGICYDYNTKGWGNVRAPYDPALGRATPIPGRGNFAVYPTWEAGLQDWCERILYRYCGTWGLFTVQKATPKYAPSSDGNNPARYAATVAKNVAAWST